LKIKARKPFKEDCKRIESRMKDPRPIRKALFRVISMLQQGKNLPEKYVVNPLLARGQGWYDCYVYDDIIMI
jgi:addiction module RelE/StbE family toxin